MSSDKRNLTPSAIVLEIEGRENIVLDISTPDSRKKLSEHPVKIKEGTTYSIKIVFRVRFNVVTGLKYLEERKRQGILIEKSDTFMVIVIRFPLCINKTQLTKISGLLCAYPGGPARF